MFDVLGVGVATVDDLLWVPRYPARDSKVRILRSERRCGGLAATALATAARLGASAAYAGVLGNDERSAFVLECLRDAGVDTGHVAFRPDATPGHSTIVVDLARGTRTVLSDPGGSARHVAGWPPAAVVRSGCVLLVDHVRLGVSLRAARVAGREGIPVVADLERADDPRFGELLGLVDHLVISRAFASHLTGETHAGRAAVALRTEARTVVVTCGAAGTWEIEGTMRRALRRPAFIVEAVDTTGCGDVFHGAYAAALAWGLGLGERVRLASAAAALSATRSGGIAALPDRVEVERLLAAATT